jgi:uncharacterized protein YdeI (YjbR/CyaY-like superfamily)
MSKKNPSVDGYLRKNKKWQKELEALRTIALDTPLTEEVKWRVPCYTFEGKNIAFLGAFKESCAFSFVKGALLKDARGILQLPGENTQSARVIRFTDLEQIVKIGPILKAYVDEAIKIEKAGLKVKFKTPAEFKLPEELQNKFKQRPDLKTAFAALTPGRQRGYVLHFSGAKQSKTREARIEKCVPRILDGKGLDD